MKIDFKKFIQRKEKIQTERVIPFLRYFWIASVTLLISFLVIALAFDFYVFWFQVRKLEKHYVNIDINAVTVDGDLQSSVEDLLKARKEKFSSVRDLSLTNPFR